MNEPSPNLAFNDCSSPHPDPSISHLPPPRRCSRTLYATICGISSDSGVGVDVGGPVVHSRLRCNVAVCTVDVADLLRNVRIYFCRSREGFTNILHIIIDYYALDDNRSAWHKFEGV